jgi:hypothetical protein
MKSTRHGFEFDETWSEQLWQLAQDGGDIPQETGSTTGGKPNGKVGDYAITLGPEVAAALPAPRCRCQEECALRTDTQPQGSRSGAAAARPRAEGFGGEGLAARQRRQATAHNGGHHHQTERQRRQTASLWNRRQRVMRVDGFRDDSVAARVQVCGVVAQ